MTEVESSAPEKEPKVAPKFYSIAAIIAVIVIGGIWLISRFTADDYARDMQSWREKLNLVAESRTAALNEWVGGHFAGLRTLADNPSLRLYMTELQAMPANPQGDGAEVAQKTYLRNLLLFTAERGGYSDALNEKIKANVQAERNTGLAVLNNKHEIVVSTSMDAPTKQLMLREVNAMRPATEKLIDIQKGHNNQVVMGFVVPIFSIQGDRTPESQIGKIVGIIQANDKLLNLLKHPGVVEKTLETILVRRNRDKVEFLSQLQDGSSPMARDIPFDVIKSAEAMLIGPNGNFTEDKRDYRNVPIIGTSRPIAGTPWNLIVKIDRKEALAASDERRAGMVAIAFMIIAVIVSVIIAIWWYAHSQRALFMSRQFRKMASEAMAQEELLRLVADNQPEAIYMLDSKGTYQFANKTAADNAKSMREDLIGKSLSSVRGAATADKIFLHCDLAMKNKQSLFNVAHLHEGKRDFIIRSAYIPLEQIPIVTLPPHTKGVLVVEQDITEVMRERERRIEIQQELVHSLVRLVDKRDPFAANHSTLVAMMAYEVAKDMGLDEVTIDTTRIAGNLMNIGKILITPELLTKTENLTEEEKKEIRASMHQAADLLKDIPFDGPVVDTLRQWQEKWDGTGPLGMKGDNILISARIIAVANAFIGMISPRSWRTAIPIEKANKFLLDNADVHFDRRVVIALVNHIENHKGRTWIEAAIEGKRSAA